MPFIKKLALVLLLLSGSLLAQPADTSLYRQVSAHFMRLFNSQKFDSIYVCLSSNFKAGLKKAELTEFLKNSLYTTLGPILQLDSAKNEQEFFSYLAYFKIATLRLKLAVNTKGEIDGLQFLPYLERPPAGKRLEYATDNKQQSQLDLLVDSLVKSYMQSPQNCGLGIGISKNGTNMFYNYGEVKRDGKQLPDQNTLYEIGSLTKTFCGLLLANAVAEKKISLDDDVRRYLPGKYANLELDKKPILIKHLANHTSGLPRVPEDLFTQPGFDSLNPYKNYTKQQVLGSLKTVTLSAEPGTVCDYSNLGMALLGIILEDLYHQSFETLVKEKICAPAGMPSTAVHLSGEQLKRFADGYNQQGLPTPHWELDGMSAAGALRSSPADMLNYLNYNMAEKDAPTQLAHQPTYSSRETVALAWFLKKSKTGNTLVWHNGGTYGFSGFCGFIKEKNCSVILLGNSSDTLDRMAIALFNFLQQ